MLDAISAEVVRMPNGSNHHLLKYPPICPPVGRVAPALLLGPYKVALTRLCVLHKTLAAAHGWRPALPYVSQKFGSVHCVVGRMVQLPSLTTMISKS